MICNEQRPDHYYQHDCSTDMLPPLPASPFQRIQKSVSSCESRPARSSAQRLESAGVFAVSTDGGKAHIGATILSNWAKEAASAISNFQAKRIRSGVETLLASAGISSDIRGRLQSHGIAGVQARHYDGYDYLAEKRKALDALYSLLAQAQKDVTKKTLKPSGKPQVDRRDPVSRSG
ncbi:hypothetical protein [Variovorax paradoxus]|uniref:hypothetical protein n=1 Tax=Variovorax paradoxus TaxID=34073 RepID=UPI003ECC469B